MVFLQRPRSVDAFTDWFSSRGVEIVRSVHGQAIAGTHPALAIHDRYSHFLQFGIADGAALEAIVSINCGTRPVTRTAIDNLSSSVAKYLAALCKIGHVLQLLRQGRSAGSVPLCGEVAGHLLREWLRCLCEPDKSDRRWRKRLESLGNFVTVTGNRYGPWPKGLGDALKTLDSTGMFAAIAESIDACHPVLVSAWLRDGTGVSLAADGDSDWIRVAHSGVFAPATAALAEDLAWQNLSHRRDTYPLTRLVRRLQPVLAKDGIASMPIVPLSATVLAGNESSDAVASGSQALFHGVQARDGAIHVLRPEKEGGATYASLHVVAAGSVEAAAAMRPDAPDVFVVWSPEASPTAARVKTWVLAAMSREKPDTEDRVIVAGMRRRPVTFDLGACRKSRNPQCPA